MDKKYLQGYADLTEHEIITNPAIQFCQEDQPIEIEIKNIEYEINDEDAEANECLKEDLANMLPQSMRITVNYTKDNEELNERILNEISTQTGMLVQSYKVSKVWIY